MDKRGEIYWSPNGNPRRKIFFDSNGGIPLQDIWLDYKDAHNQNIHITGYPTEKNLDMIKILIKSSSDEGDLVLDCCAGSGTALIAADSLKRNWIGIDNSPQAIKTIVDRFHFGTKPMGDFVSSDDSGSDDQMELFLHSTESTDAHFEAHDNGWKPIKDFSLFTVEEHIYQLPELVLPKQIAEKKSRYVGSRKRERPKHHKTKRK
jgi:adenine-specific DNA-methyltransferase